MSGFEVFALTNVQHHRVFAVDELSGLGRGHRIRGGATRFINNPRYEHQQKCPHEEGVVHYEFEQLIDHREHNLLVYAEKSGVTRPQKRDKYTRHRAYRAGHDARRLPAL